MHVKPSNSRTYSILKNVVGKKGGGEGVAGVGTGIIRVHKCTGTVMSENIARLLALWALNVVTITRLSVSWSQQVSVR